LGDKVVTRDIDIFSKVGRFMPFDEYINFNYDGLNAHIEGEIVPNAVIDGKLNVKLLKGKADNPKVNAILLV
jgi:hypothetical protein